MRDSAHLKARNYLSDRYLCFLTISLLIKVSAIWPLLKREVHQENLTNYGKSTGRHVTISNSQSARRALWASSPQPIWAVAAGSRILRQRCWHKKSRKCICLQDHVNLYLDIKVITSYCSIIGKPISGQDTSRLTVTRLWHTHTVATSEIESDCASTSTMRTSGRPSAGSRNSPSHGSGTRQKPSKTRT